MSIENENPTHLTPAPRIFPAKRSTPLPEKAPAEHREDVVDFYAVATDSFQARLDWIENQGQKGSPDWHPTNGLLRLAQGLQLKPKRSVRVVCTVLAASELAGVSHSGFRVRDLAGPRGNAPPGPLGARWAGDSCGAPGGLRVF